MYKGYKGEPGKYEQSGFVTKRTGYNRHGQGMGICSIIILAILVAIIISWVLYVAGMV
jgi:hypothetical protein